MKWTIILICAFVGVLTALFWETYRLKRNRKKLLHVIHVNGIRGKSTTTRLIAAALREGGYKVACKTTGTLPIYSGPDGVDQVIRRLGSSNIREQKRILHRAVKDGAEVLVIECMAVSPELQALCQHRILRADYCVMTKILPDHTDVLGDSEREIARSLSNTVPSNGTIFTLPDNYGDVFEETASRLGTHVQIAEQPFESGIPAIDRFPENVRLAYAMAKTLGVSDEHFLAGIAHYTEDPFSFEVLEKGTLRLYNGFSANDRDSILRLYEVCRQESGEASPTILLNERADRPERTLEHIRMLIEMHPSKVLLIGESRFTVKHELRRAGIDVFELETWESIFEEQVVFACGNIHGEGQKMIEFLKKEEETDG